MRIGVLAASLVVPALAIGEPLALTTGADSPPPPLEASAFVGVGFLGSDVQLGDSWAAEQVPGNAPLVGVRLTALVLRHARLQLGVEAEVDLTTANTRSSPDRDGRMTYFAPVLGWRGQLMLRYVANELRPHVLVGAGGATVASESPYMRKETDPAIYYGVGLSIPLTDTFHVRIDGRHGALPARGGGATQFAELQVGFGGSFGFPQRRTAGRPAQLLATQPVVDETDTDGDGLPDHLDRCPAERETVNGVDDGDGCPEPDADGDTIIGAADRCPDVAEDLDGFEDDDGCPDPDNDRDGIEDVRDACPLVPETRNGIDDEDGCPDTVPPEVATLLASTSSGLAFEPNRARVTSASKAALAPLVTLLAARKNLRVEIIARPLTQGATDLARRRADAVKWYLIEQGAAEKQFLTRVAPAGKGPAVSLALLP